MLTNDFDADGDLDLIAAIGDRVVWYERLDGQVAFGEEQTLWTAAPRSGSFQLFDLDDDGDLDVLQTRNNRNAEPHNFDDLYWIENLDGRGEFAPERRIVRNKHLSDITPADVDGDGDFDLVALTDLAGGLVWYEHLDGQVNFGQRNMIAPHAYGRSYKLADVDNDGRLDVVDGFREISWFENRPLGDVNDDGLFNSSDLVVVMQREKYEDPIPVWTQFLAKASKLGIDVSACV